MTRMARILFVGLLFGLILGMFYPIAYAEPEWPDEMGNDRHHQYRPPWRERDEWWRHTGCAVNDPEPICSGHRGINEWAIDLNKGVGDEDCGEPLRVDRLGSAQVIPYPQGGGYGHLLGITHLNSVGPPVDLDSSWYAHMEKFTNDQPWDTVFAQGDYVGNSSNSGGDYYCHLHYQVNDEDKDPVVWYGYNTINIWFGPWPWAGYNIQHLSDDNMDYQPSNNTGPGYGRPYYGTCTDPLWEPGRLCADKGPEDEPKSWPMRTLARNAAAYAVDVGSTRAAIQGPCGANRRWVKSCYFGYSGLGYTQSFVLNYGGLEFPLSITEGPDGNAYRVTRAMWKAQGRLCGANRVHEGIGKPINEEYPVGSLLDAQDFQFGHMQANRYDAQNVYVDVYDNSWNLLCSLGVPGAGGFYDWLDLDNEPCYDVDGDSWVNILDVLLVAKRMGTSETDPINPTYPGFDYDDRYDVDRNGYINILDPRNVAVQMAEHRRCK